MTHFQYKVTELKTCESLTYTICLNMLADEYEAMDAAKQILIELFRDDAFFEQNELHRQNDIFKKCVRYCIDQRKMAAAAKPAYVS
ncbi:MULTISPECIES: hypothetical protein [unclassified Paenibacillus]|uniref:hypothetical protein n=1 Tax=unclassified Paenibacillus TaxID=185978 RepID=UPI0036D26E13